MHNVSFLRICPDCTCSDKCVHFPFTAASVILPKIVGSIGLQLYAWGHANIVPAATQEVCIAATAIHTMCLGLCQHCAHSDARTVH